jgi:methylated-DNA-[protein]-cysteine S-methyltransferase
MARTIANPRWRGKASGRFRWYDPDMGDRYYAYTPSPIGKLLLAGDEGALRCLAFVEGRHPTEPAPEWTPAEEPFRETARQLAAYFAGELTAFDLPLELEGTPFQQTVWRALCDIPYGETISYGELARRIAKPEAVRAVGAANGQNPVAIVVPCHRVIGSNGKLTGYGGGLPVKEALLALERKQRSLF